VSADGGVAPESPESLRAALAALTWRLATVDAWIERHEQTHDQTGALLEDELRRRGGP
jgi:hypothetical protein